jgi:hypothetical protein
MSAESDAWAVARINDGHMRQFSSMDSMVCKVAGARETVQMDVISKLLWTDALRHIDAIHTVKSSGSLVDHCRTCMS